MDKGQKMTIIITNISLISTGEYILIAENFSNDRPILSSVKLCLIFFSQIAESIAHICTPKRFYIKENKHVRPDFKHVLAVCLVMQM